MIRPATKAVLAGLFVGTLCGGGTVGTVAAAGEPVAALLEQSCLDCHAGPAAEGGLDLAAPDPADPAAAAAVWEAVVRRLRTGQMPPAELPRPDAAAVAAALGALESELDAAAVRAPRPGRTATFRRLTRAEYQHAVRDLLAVEVNAAELLPADEEGHGFDNVTVGELSPTRLNRFLAAAERVARQAVGRPGGAGDVTVRLPPDRTQEAHAAGLPPGTRGGAVVSHAFPRTGEYEIAVRLMRDRNEEVEGLDRPHRLEILLDGEPAATFTVEPPRRSKGPDGGEPPDHAAVDRHLTVRLTVPAGPHAVGATFAGVGRSLIETARRPPDARFNFYRHPRRTPAVYQITIAGPLDASEAGDPPSRRRLLGDLPENLSDDDRAAAALARLARRAYRRPVSDADLAPLRALYEAGRDEVGPDENDFDAGLELAVAGALVNPNFLFKIERDPPGLADGEAYPVDDVALASRLSFFLWASGPDEALLDLAERGELSRPGELGRQVRRMLADERADALATNFAGQWLRLRNLEGAAPDMRRFPDFDDNLRDAFRRESELLVADVLRNDRPVTDLLAPGYAHLNERLATHYGLPGVRGSRFRKVSLPDNTRGGLLRQGSVLTVTSYANRTSPVLRGAWVLENLLGTPPPPPPPDIPDLEDNTVAAGLPVRARLAAHRANAACAVCHDRIDPLGLALEGYDAVGRVRRLEEDRPVDTTGGFPGGGPLSGVADLEAALLDRPDLFATALTEKLLIYALGRGLTPHDAPAVRQIVRQAEAAGWRSATLLTAVTESTPFRLRAAAASP
ncbi:DUF1592 domain-containing protein [Alienimonas californiensis]|uniref:Cytochrome c domain-containing protein n=1 Tax=Alienimonas californiensis TaxID=2527989 RepID=A0A517P6K5_9PLAN|nr:DUF1592 domain-containing protein [Alienimonas californiensis]QDT15008.1 hypothetical protein CA12_10880 [Alienimonas californiensis]